MRGRQAYGCLAIAGLAAAIAAAFVVLGLLCIRSHGNFDCIGLLTVFPIAFIALALAALAVALQNLKGAGRASARPRISLGETRDLPPRRADDSTEE